jgi:hypothetical protein
MSKTTFVLNPYNEPSVKKIQGVLVIVMGHLAYILP